jgi:hypothetical protein
MAVTTAIFGQAIGHPQRHHARSCAGSTIGLGPFHKHLKEHIRKLIAQSDLLFGDAAKVARFSAAHGISRTSSSAFFARQSHSLLHLTKLLVSISKESSRHGTS